LPARARFGTLPALNATPGYLALFVGLFAVSTAGPFFRMAHVDAYAAVFWRTALAGLIALTIAAMRSALKPREVASHARAVVLGGFLLGTHFLLWIKAFDLTDFASNHLLLVAQPLFGTLIGRLLGQSAPRSAGLSLLLAVGGMAFITGADISLGPRALLGDALCVVAGLMIALFYAVARSARAALPLDVFMGCTTLVAACTALPVALSAGVPLWGYTSESWAWLLGIVVVTTLGGHGLMNLAARHVPMFELNLVIVLEPVIAIALGFMLFGATVTPPQVAGGALLAVAMVVGLRRESAPLESAATTPR
jgi:drug/metabolite transporter (DMT)-like permease